MPAPARTTSLFTGPGAVIDQPTSIYVNDQIPFVNTLRPYPQFDGSFTGYRRTEASSWYNAVQFVFHRRAGHYLSLEGNYSYSRWYDNSSSGANNFLGTLGAAPPQALDRLNYHEWSLSGNDAPQRAVIGGIVTLPIGRGELVGKDMNRVLDGVIGGWKVSTLSSFQSGQPLTVRMNKSRLADGNQRPNYDSTCKLKTGISWTNAAETGNPYFNSGCFSSPGDQQLGNGLRYYPNMRTQGVRNFDFSLQKDFNLQGEGRTIEVRADCFNCTNTPRFRAPNTRVGSGSFGEALRTRSDPRGMQLAIDFNF